MRHSVRRTAATLLLDLRRQAVGGYWSVAVLVGAVVAGMVRGLGVEPTRWWPILLLGELTVTCFYFAAVQVLAERGEGMLTARALTPAREEEYLAALMLSLGALAVLESAVLVLVAGDLPRHWPALIAGVLVLAALEVLYGVSVVAGYDTAAAFLLPSGLWTAVFIVPVLPLMGLGGGWWLWLHPLQPAVILVEVAFDRATTALSVPAVVVGALWAAVGMAVARRRLHAMSIEAGEKP
ncbi:hypothetical protein [Actinomyces qiguomingii]|uniref:fluoroquinolone export ABC transporter permease subunit n=1 Tax=Actinomyces qiguomingii TaxID=2057800 RepID=UPI000CA05494|nr:hypothetical protein [Actinomyces qiguomingii]